MARWQTANILQTSAAGRHFWQLSASGDRFVVQSDKALLLNDPLPPRAAAKQWQTLFRGKLNIAWLPPEKVFLRAVHLPPSEPGELNQMVELQMEKLSPLPVTHVVWSMHPLPRQADKPDALQTVIVIIAARSVVEEFLGGLEKDGFLADRLEAPGLDQFLAMDIKEEGAWVFPGAAGEPALVAWWYGGTVQNVTLVSLATGHERGAQLRTQIEQIAWAGELEGWLPGTPKIHLVAGRAEAAFWEPVFKEAGEQMDVIAPMSEPQLASRAAERCATNPATNLLPPEFAKRYHQRFVDGLWMRGLFTVLSAYVIGVMFYFGMLYTRKSEYDKVKKQLTAVSVTYTNALKDQAEYTILEDLADLKFAGLDCWKAVAENLPETITLDDMYFDRGKFELSGSVPAEEIGDVDHFNETLREIANPNKDGEPLFSDVSAPSIKSGPVTANWHFNCTLKEGATSE